MSKQVIKIALAFVLSCSMAYLIGQKVVLPLTDKKAAEKQQEMVESNEQQDQQQKAQRNGEHDNAEIYDLIQNFSNLTITGQKTVEDNPWGSNLTTFEDEELGTCLLMTPGTEISDLYVVQEEEVLCWSCGIHPWMAGVSDGVDLTITVREADQDDQETTVTIPVTSSEVYETGNIPLSEFQGMEIQLTLSVGNGDNNDSSGDWLVFDRLMIASVQVQN